MEYHYLNKDNHPVGPVSEEALIALHRANVLTDDSLVFREDSKDWLPFHLALRGPKEPSQLDHVNPPPRKDQTPRKEGRKSKVGFAAISIFATSLLGWGIWHWYQNAARSPKSSNEGSSTSQEGGEKNATYDARPNGEVDLSEWYEFGHHQGLEALRTFGDFGLPIVAERAHVALLIKNLGVDVRTLNPEGIKLCFEGFQDGVDKRPVARTHPKSQTSSILPAPLRGYIDFPSDISAPASTGREVLDHAIAATAIIRNYGADGSQRHGSGFFVARGTLVTNRHVVKGAASVEVGLNSGVSVPGRVIALSDKLDVALVAIDHRDHEIVQIGRSEDVRVGDDVAAIGFPAGNGVPIVPGGSATATFGKISSIAADREVDGNPCFHLDLTINHGNSGGPLISQKTGVVIGVNTFGFAHTGIDRFNFAIKVDALLPFIRDNSKEPIEVSQ